jgi:integrase/recombinase XerD
MAIVHVFTRHKKACPKIDDPQWKRCSCPKFLHWSENGKFKRSSAKTCRWEDACRVARRVEQQLAEAHRERIATHSVTVTEAVNAFLADKRSQQLAPDTLKKLENIFQKQLANWCDAHSVRILPELDLTHLREWRATWEDGPLSAKKKQERLIGFFFFCQSAGWIHSNPAKGLSRIRVKENPTLYFCSWDTLQSERLRSTTLPL